MDAKPKPKARMRACATGLRRRFTTAQQIDNDRWNRIFNERFADPDYYTTAPRGTSTLGPALRPGRSDRRSTVSGSE
jgi:hypothetical protein